MTNGNDPQPVNPWLKTVGEWLGKYGVASVLLLAMAYGVWQAYVGPQQERYDKLLDTVLTTQEKQAESIEKIANVLEAIDERTSKWER